MSQYARDTEVPMDRSRNEIERTLVGEWARPQLEAAYQSGKMPPLLPSGME